jgi:hypothetical protein
MDLVRDESFPLKLVILGIKKIIKNYADFKFKLTLVTKCPHKVKIIERKNRN